MKHATALGKLQEIAAQKSDASERQDLLAEVAKWKAYAAEQVKHALAAETELTLSKMGGGVMQ